MARRADPPSKYWHDENLAKRSRSTFTFISSFGFRTQMSLSPHTTPSGWSTFLMFHNLLTFSCRISTPFHTCCASFLHVRFHPSLIQPKKLTSHPRQQPNPSTQATVTEHWTRLILSYGRFKKIWLIKLEDAEVAGNDWDEILRNDRINRKLPSSHLGHILKQMVAKNQAVYDPPKQTRSVLLYWRTPEEWAEVLHEWAISTGQLNTILTFYEIIEPSIPSPLSGIPLPILRKAISILTATNRAQIITIADGEGVRLLAGK